MTGSSKLEPEMTGQVPPGLPALGQFDFSRLMCSCRRWLVVAPGVGSSMVTRSADTVVPTWRVHLNANANSESVTALLLEPPRVMTVVGRDRGVQATPDRNVGVCCAMPALHR